MWSAIQLLIQERVDVMPKTARKARKGKPFRALISGGLNFRITITATGRSML